MRFVILVIPYLIGRGERVHLAGPNKVRFRILMDRLCEQMQYAQTLPLRRLLHSKHKQGSASSRRPIRCSGTISLRSTRERYVWAQVGLNLTGINPVQLAENITMLDHFTNGHPNRALRITLVK